MQKRTNLTDTIKVLPVVVIHDLSETEPMLEALRDGGIPAAEITFRTPCAAEAIRIGCKTFPDMHIGAGTVINTEQAKTAIVGGAEVCRAAGVPYYPGCVTPTEIMAALELGITTVKFFPANVYGGLASIRALSAPFPQVRFLPTGGVDLSNLAEYLACDRVAAVGGSFMMKGDIRWNCRRIREVIG